MQIRPQQRQVAEERLFQKILDAFASKKKTVEQVFNELDIDGNGELSLTEFRKGLESLKIILSPKDLNNIFCIFDKDKSNSISLLEMKQELADYIVIKLFNSDEQTQDEYLGEVKVAWKCCINHPDEFYISREFTNTNLSFPEKQVQGFIGVQLKYNPLQIQKMDDLPQIISEVKDLDNKQELNSQDYPTQNYKTQFEQQQKSRININKNKPIAEHEELKPNFENMNEMLRKSSQYFDKNDNDYYKNADSDISPQINNNQIKNKNQNKLKKIDSNISDYMDQNEFANFQSELENSDILKFLNQSDINYDGSKNIDDFDSNIGSLLEQ
ncbi:hypothetical protein PPERSA_01725 [Pseudocohnilembus persalinus]|uniref:EF-hand domain-containing protein n=1 Tax=Pseudocohnilembus persalinus TaxID=266149 RepID=A0A0V0Q800_PSEPJ|nr:hypothetical protein PPERSA_01725 [Pseudocohnilembus persalinus]|eukprot:KRW98287.1 hypothetical protein PPERSA_01725 [Pseudocohnilembus persalinus]